MSRIHFGHRWAATAELGGRRKDFWNPSRWEWVPTAQLVRDTIGLIPRLPHDIGGIAGVPRSGMIPASVLATHLHLPLFQATKDGILPIGHGRGKLSGFGTKMLVVDDTAYKGTTLAELRAQYGDTCLYGAVYARPAATMGLDFYARTLESPHLLEWNLWNGAPLVGLVASPEARGGVAADFDGVLCPDHPASIMDGSPEYERWLAEAPPLNLPRRYPVPLLVTYRYERYRDVTEAWLQRHGIKWGRLVMHPEGPRDFTPEGVARHKGAAYRDSPCTLFIESDRRQCWPIHEASGKAVLHLSSGEILQ